MVSARLSSLKTLTRPTPRATNTTFPAAITSNFRSLTRNGNTEWKGRYETAPAATCSISTPASSFSLHRQLSGCVRHPHYAERSPAVDRPQLRRSGDVEGQRQRNWIVCERDHPYPREREPQAVRQMGQL